MPRTQLAAGTATLLRAAALWTGYTLPSWQPGGTRSPAGSGGADDDDSDEEGKADRDDPYSLTALREREEERVDIKKLGTFPIVHGIRTRVHNTVRCLREFPLEVEDVVFSPIAAAQVSIGTEA